MFMEFSIEINDDDDDNEHATQSRHVIKAYHFDD